MARPVVSETAEDLYESLGPLTKGDEERDWQLLDFCDALCSVLFEQIHGYVSDRDGRPGWQIVFDPEDAPIEVLSYLAQYAGVELEPELTEAEARAKILLPEGFARGTPAALIAAAKRTLTGAGTVLLVERHEGSAYKIWVRTLLAETPDEDATRAALLTQKPIGIHMLYEVVEGQSWADVDSKHADWDEVESTYEDWTEVKTTAP